MTISLFICQVCGKAFFKHFTKLVCSIRTETWQDLALLKVSHSTKKPVMECHSNHDQTTQLHSRHSQPKEKILLLNKGIFYHIVKLNTPYWNKYIVFVKLSKENTVRSEQQICREVAGKFEANTSIVSR